MVVVVVVVVAVRAAGVEGVSVLGHGLNSQLLRGSWNTMPPPGHARTSALHPVFVSSGAIVAGGVSSRRGLSRGAFGS